MSFFEFLSEYVQFHFCIFRYYQVIFPLFTANKPILTACIGMAPSGVWVDTIPWCLTKGGCTEIHPSLRGELNCTGPYPQSRQYGTSPQSNLLNVAWYLSQPNHYHAHADFVNMLALYYVIRSSWLISSCVFIAYGLRQLCNFFGLFNGEWSELHRMNYQQ